jgi:hypothetical protein
VACGNNNITRDYLSSQPTEPQRPASSRSSSSPRRDTSLDSPLRDWNMKGSVTEKPPGSPRGTEGEYLDRMGAHVYFGGIGEPDGLGHGHGWLDKNGNFEVWRDPFDPAGGPKTSEYRANRANATGKYVPARAKS